MTLPTLSPAMQQRLRRVGSFLLMALILWGLNQLHDALNTGLVGIPDAWRPYVPLAVTGIGAVIAVLTPQMLQLRTAAFANTAAPVNATEISEAVARAVVQSLATQTPAPAPTATPAVASAVPPVVPPAA